MTSTNVVNRCPWNSDVPSQNFTRLSIAQVFAIGSFIPQHPGGFLIRRAIGEDATEHLEGLGVLSLKWLRSSKKRLFFLWYFHKKWDIIALIIQKAIIVHHQLLLTQKPQFYFLSKIRHGFRWCSGGYWDSTSPNHIKSPTMGWHPTLSDFPTFFCCPLWIGTLRAVRFVHHLRGFGVADVYFHPTCDDVQWLLLGWMAVKPPTGFHLDGLPFGEILKRWVSKLCFQLLARFGEIPSISFKRWSRDLQSLYWVVQNRYTTVVIPHSVPIWLSEWLCIIIDYFWIFLVGTLVLEIVWQPIHRSF